MTRQEQAKRREEVLAMRSSGAKPPAIATALGLSIAYVRSLTCPGKGSTTREAQAKNLDNMLASARAGMSVPDLAISFGYTEQTVRNYLSKHQITMRIVIDKEKKKLRSPVDLFDPTLPIWRD